MFSVQFLVFSEPVRIFYDTKGFSATCASASQVLTYQKNLVLPYAVDKNVSYLVSPLRHYICTTLPKVEFRKYVEACVLLWLYFTLLFHIRHVDFIIYLYLK